MVSRQQQTWSGEIDLRECRIICQEVIDAIADYHAVLSGRGVIPEFRPDEVRALLAEVPSEEGESTGALPFDWLARVMHRLMAMIGLRELFSKSHSLAGHLHDLVRDHPGFEVLHEPTSYLYCFRYVPAGLAERREEPGVQALLDRLNREIVEAVRRTGSALVMTTQIRGRVVIRISICSHRTLQEDMDATFEAIARWGRLLTRTHSIRYEKPPETEALQCSSESCSSPTEVSAT